MNIPVCCVTGRIAGDSDACGDCDPCYAAHTVPPVVKRLLAERDEWREKYAKAMEAQCETCGGTGEIDQRLGGEATSGIVPCPDCR